MTKKDCLFCKIINRIIDEEPIWENEDFAAYLDRNPNTKGASFVVSKKHYDSDILEMDGETLFKFIRACQETVRLMKKVLGVKRVALVIEGMGINHAHIKLYPMYGVNKKFKEAWSKQRVYLDKYKGYITTQLGPEIDRRKLKSMAKEFRQRLNKNNLT